MKKLTRRELLDEYFKFFESKGHKLIKSASLIPENDPTVLFTTAGMHPLVPYLLGMEHVDGKRLVDVQKCIRTSDIDSVGDDSHLTFFEMLGNWSLGDYFKQEMISWSYEFLTSKDYLDLDKDKLYFTVFEGNDEAPRDTVSYNEWIKNGVSEDHIFFLPKENNWWELGSKSGPCGPDSEMFYDTGKEKCSPDCNPSCSCGKYLEIWNDVFMEFEAKDNKYLPLKNKNVDTGMGVERTITVLNGKNSVYDTDIFENVKNKLEELSGKKYEDNKKQFRIVMDHLRTSVFILADDVHLTPSNTGSGYVLRRLIRRMIRYINEIIPNYTDENIKELINVVIDDYKYDYKELERNKTFIQEEMLKEIVKFNKTIKQGYKAFEKETRNLKDNNISAEVAFKLFDTFGFPLEFTKEIALEKGYSVDTEGFNKKFEEHKEKSKSIEAGEYKGGLADNSIESIKYHTLAHLVLACLKEMYGDSIYQKGSNITPERLRLDFPLDHKMTEEEKQTLTDKVNAYIRMNLPVVKEEMSLEEARKANAEGAFQDKYGERVFVYTIGDNVSKEICGGPHVENTSQLGTFEIIKEESSSSGTRRIKAVLK